MYLDGKTPNEIARILESDIDTINRDIIYLYYNYIILICWLLLNIYFDIQISYT